MNESIWLAIATLITALGLPHLYRYAFSHLSNKKKYEASNGSEIQELKLRIKELETSVELLLLVIKGEFADSPGIEAAIAKVEEHLKVAKKVKKDIPN